MGLERRKYFIGLLACFLLALALAGSPAPARAAHPADSPRMAQGPDQPDAESGEKVIVVRIAAQRVNAYQGSALVYDFPVSTGRNGNTAAGSFRILDKYPSAKNAQWGYAMPLWMGVYWVGPHLENGFHALPVLPDGTEIWGDSIGSPASDGCIVLRRADMQMLYDWAEVGTPVVIEP